MKNNVLIKLFITNFYLSAFTFGGGYVIITLMKDKYVDKLHWIEEKEMLDLVAIAQSAPGPIAVNGAVLVGFKLAGIKGALVSIVATILPPFIVLSLVSMFYELFKSNEIVALVLSGMQGAVGAIIASVTYDMASSVIKEKEMLLNIIMLLAFIITYFFNINVIFVVLACGIIGLLQSFLHYWRQKA